MLVDSAYGSSSEFRNAVRAHGLDFGVAVQANTKVWPLDRLGRRRGDPVNVQDLGIKLGTLQRQPRRQQRIARPTQHAPREPAASMLVVAVRVRHDDGTEAKDREPLWLVIEWPEGESKPTKFVLTTLPRRLTKKAIVRIIMERWRTERAYEELKGELGLDHFEGRSFPGWHHHISVVLCCYAFVVSERMRRFSPSLGRKTANRSVSLAA